MSEKFDVVIIGSGAGGSPIARTLTEKGKSVLILEKGPMLTPQQQSANRRSAFKRDELTSDGAEKILRLPGIANIGASFFTSHVEPDLNDEPHVYRDQNGQDRATIEGYTAQVVGGGTQLYGGVSLRFTEVDMRLQSFNAGRGQLPLDPNRDVQRNARDWPVSYTQLEPYYCLAEKMVGINGDQQNQKKRANPNDPTFSQNDTYQPPLTPNPISKYAFEGMKELGQRVTPGNPAQPYRTPLAVITRDHAPSGRKVPRDQNGQPAPETAKTSYVNRYGDPLGLKSNTWVSLLTPVKDRANFQIRCNCVVTRMSSQNGKVDKVFYLDPSGFEQEVEGTIVVVACSAIESVRLLKLSAALDADFGSRINQNNLLGKYFLTHCFGGASALVGDRFDKSMALDADWATDACASREFLDSKKLWAGGAIYNNTSDQALPLSLLRTHGSQDLDTLWDGFRNDRGLRGQGLIDLFDNTFGRGLSVSFMANQLPQETNRIELHPSVTDKWNRPTAYIIKDWHSHDRYLMDTLAQQCGDVLRLGAQAIGATIGKPFEFQGQGGVYAAPNGLARIANHVLGGARFGTDRNDSVLNDTCRAWDFDNLYVTDGSWMPTAGGGNPTLTIQANSFRVADHLLTRI